VNSSGRVATERHVNVRNSGMQGPGEKCRLVHRPEIRSHVHRNDRPYHPAHPVAASCFVGQPVEFPALIDPQQATECACIDYMYVGVHHTKFCYLNKQHFDSK